MPEGNANPERFKRPDGSEVVDQRTPPPAVQQAAAAGAATGAAVKEVMERGTGGLRGMLKDFGNLTWMTAGMVLLFLLYRDNRSDQLEYRRAAAMEAAAMVGAVSDLKSGLQQNSQRIDQNTRAVEKLVDRLDKRPMP
jgi:hypothetical protein